VGTRKGAPSTDPDVFGSKLPTLLEYLSFMYFYANTLVGPACEYLDHDNFINRRETYKETPRTFFASLGYLVSGLFFMGVITKQISVFCFFIVIWWALLFRGLRLLL